MTSPAEMGGGAKSCVMKGAQRPSVFSVWGVISGCVALERGWLCVVMGRVLSVCVFRVRGVGSPHAAAQILRYVAPGRGVAKRNTHAEMVEGRPAVTAAGSAGSR